MWWVANFNGLILFSCVQRGGANTSWPESCLVGKLTLLPQDPTSSPGSGGRPPGRSCENGGWWTERSIYPQIVFFLGGFLTWCSHTKKIVILSSFTWVDSKSLAHHYDIQTCSGSNMFQSLWAIFFWQHKAQGTFFLKHFLFISWMLVIKSSVLVWMLLLAASVLALAEALVAKGETLKTQPRSCHSPSKCGG